MSQDVTIHKQPPAALVRLLERHVPHSLPLLRRLQFARSVPGGITEHANIVLASSDGSGSDGSNGSASFAAAYLDFSRAPETEMWLYASLERRRSEKGEHKEVEEVEEEEEEVVVRVLRAVKRLRDAYSDGRGRRTTVLAGTLSEAVRCALANRGVVFPYSAPYDKWMFHLDALPDVPSPLADDMVWDRVHKEDIPLVLSRTHIARKERTVILLPSMAIYRKDGPTPIAWSFLGPDSSLSSLHCEEGYRGKGFAKAVAVKLLRERLKDYGDDGYCWADVAPDNPSSQGVCKGLGGKIAWTVSWSRIDLDRSFPDQ
ncbi:hypothetical protein F4779DRAFT_398865 [Xylariaceae sp. FL0662B]|nr:hypothetical protein F4779DRAFT_398865 [Xylariaceae sp. FL0662B]